MAGPWEQYAQAPAAPEGPWEQFAPKSDRTLVEKLTGMDGGERVQLWPERLARGIASSVASGVTLPGDVYSGKAQVDPANPEFIGRTLDFAGTAAPMAPRAAPTVDLARSGLPTAGTLREASDAGYTQARELPLTVDAGAVKNVAQGIQRSLEEKGLLGEFAPDTFTVLRKLQSPEPGAYATGSNLISAREALRNASQNFINAREARAANEAIAELDRFIENPPAESVLAGSPAEFAKIARDARGNYAASKRSEQITGQVDEAHGNAAAANSGQNIGNAVRQRFNAIVKSDKKPSGFTDEEIAQAERIRDGTVPGNVARFTGNLLGGGGGLGAVASAATGAAALGPAGAAAPVIGYALKKLSDASVERQVRLLDEMTRRRAPLANTSAYQKAQQDALRQALLASPTNRRAVFMSMMHAARNQMTADLKKREEAQ